MASNLAPLGAIIVLLALTFCDANKMQPHYRHDELQSDNPQESATMEQSAWITGPSNNKYQFHIGKQSWLAAREKCLAQNADLVTIETASEMQWLLTHYRPQFRYLRERQVQIGLLLEAPEGDGAQAREWRWVNGRPLDVDSIKWTQGEPFDHAKGKERCAVLNINEQRIDDIDCDLGARAEFNYRFVCQRSHEKHVEHESLNNPLWKKLEDILTFFGISSPEKEEDKAKNATLTNGLEEEGYWDRVFRANANASLEQRQKEEQAKDGQKSDVTHLPEREVAKGNLTEKELDAQIREQEGKNAKGKGKNNEKGGSQEKVAAFVVENPEGKSGEEKSSKETKATETSETILIKKSSKEDKTLAKIIREDDEVPNGLTKALDAGDEGVGNNFLTAASIDNNATSAEKKQAEKAKKEENLEGKKEKEEKPKKIEEKLDKNEGKKEEEKPQKNADKREEIKEGKKEEEKPKKNDEKIEKKKEEENEGKKEEKKEVKKEVESKELEKESKEESAEKNKQSKSEEKKEIKKDEAKNEAKSTEKQNEKKEEKKADLAVEKPKIESKIESKEAILPSNKVDDSSSGEKKKLSAEIVAKTKGKPILVEDKHEDGRHGSNEGLEIVTAKKEIVAPSRENSNSSAPSDEKTMILLASAEEKSEKPTAAPKVDARNECSRANSAACIRAHEQPAANISTEENSNASISIQQPSLASNASAADAPEPIELHAIGAEANLNRNSTQKTEEKEERNEKVETTKSVESSPTASSAASSSSAAAKPTKPDPLSVVAETLERTLNSKEENGVEDEAEKDRNEGRKEKKEGGGEVKLAKSERPKWREDGEEEGREEGQRKKAIGPVQSRIKHLEQIITAVQKMIGLGGEKGGENELKEGEETWKNLEENKGKNEGKNTQKVDEEKEEKEVKPEEKKKEGEVLEGKNGKEKEEVEKKEEKKGEKLPNAEKDEGKKNAIVAEAEENSKAIVQGGSSESKEAIKENQKQSSSKEKDKAAEVHESMMAMEGDFEEAEREGKAHPGINSGDLVKNIIMGSDEKDDDCFVECGEDSGEEEEKGEAKGKKEEKQPLDGLGRKGSSRIEKYGRKNGGGQIGGEGEKLVVLKGNLPTEKLEAKQQIEGIGKADQKGGEENQQQQQGRRKERPPNEHILDQLLHNGANNKKASSIRDGDEIPPSAEIAEKKRIRDGDQEPAKVQPANGTENEMAERNLDSKADDDWVLQLNNNSKDKSGQNEAEEEKASSEESTTHSTTIRSIFPQPDFALIQRGVVPEEVQQNLREESNRIRHVYDMFNAKESVYDLMRRMQEAEAVRFPLAVDQSKSAAETIFGDEIGKNVDAKVERKRANNGGGGWSGNIGQREGQQNSATGTDFKQFSGGGFIVERP